MDIATALSFLTDVGVPVGILYYLLTVNTRKMEEINETLVKIRVVLVLVSNKLGVKNLLEEED